MGKGQALDNLRGSLLMVLAMFGFALEDMFIKQMSGALPTGQILATLGLGGFIVFALVCRASFNRGFSLAQLPVRGRR